MTATATTPSSYAPSPLFIWLLVLLVPGLGLLLTFGLWGIYAAMGKQVRPANSGMAVARDIVLALVIGIVVRMALLGLPF